MNHNSNKNYLYQSIVLIFSIIILHIVLIAGLIILIVFINGMIEYAYWVFLLGIAVIISTSIFIWKKFKTNKEALKKVVKDPKFSNSNIEMNILGGAINVKIGNQNSNGEQKQLKSIDESYPQIDDKKSI